MFFLAEAFQRSQLSRRLLVYIVISSIAIVGIATAGELYLLYRNENRAMDETLAHVEQSYVPAISASLYTLDDEQLDILLQGVLSLRYVSYIELEEEGARQTIHTYGDTRMREGRVQVSHLRHKDPSGNVQTYGTLKVVATYDDTFETLMRQGVSVLFVSFVTIVLIAMTVFVIIDRMLTRHLVRITDYHKRLSADTLDQPLELETPSLLASPPQELKVLADAINLMRQRLLDQNLDRQVMLEQLRASEERFRDVLRTSPVSLTITRITDGKILYANESAGRLVGLSADGVLGRLASEFYVDPAERKMVTQTLASQGFVNDFELRLKKVDGKPIWVSANIHRISFDNEPAMITGVVDVTERKQMEVQLRQAQKLEAIGQLTGGIAHDFNNMLGVVMGNLDLLRRKVKGDEKALEFVDAAYGSVERGAQITGKLLRFSRDEPGAPQIENANHLIEGMANLIAKSLTSAIIVETCLEDDLWNVSLDPRDFEDSLLNLALNARDAMPDGGTLRIETSNRVLSENDVQHHPDMKAGEYVEIVVEDTGSGIDPDIIDNIYQPFFSTKGAGKGTGLGLSMVYGFVKRCAGFIRVDSELGKGARFEMYVPRAHGELSIEDGPQEYAKQDMPRGDETVLVVDDEEALLDVAVSYLEDLGYKTLRATSGRQALDMLKANPSVDILFSDVVMPQGMDGFELAKQAWRMRDGMKILLASGFTLKTERKNGDDPLVAKLSQRLLNKPYNQLDLALAVRQELDGDS